MLLHFPIQAVGAVGLVWSPQKKDEEPYSCAVTHYMYQPRETNRPEGNPWWTFLLPAPHPLLTAVPIPTPLFTHTGKRRKGFLYPIHCLKKTWHGISKLLLLTFSMGKIQFLDLLLLIASHPALDPCCYFSQPESSGPFSLNSPPTTSWSQLSFLGVENKNLFQACIYWVCDTHKAGQTQL